MNKGKVFLDIQADGTARVLLDDKDISSTLNAITIQVEAGGVPKITLEYNCYEQIMIDGKAEVVHICPKGGRK